MKIIVGLGNPGPRYDGTRHNIGFAAVDAILAEAGGGSWKGFGKALVARVRFAGEDVILVKPQTYMNLSGEAVQAVVSFYKAETEDLVVAHDDLDLPLGKTRIRKTGGAGGHNGIASIMGLLGSGDFVRLKMGIGRPPAGLDPSDHVLSRFEGGEQVAVNEMVLSAVKAAEAILRDGADKAMNLYN
ncbi:MAG TPA: aminoacyl-tRNA hydrolase [Nitrospirota bacterium]